MPHCWKSRVTAHISYTGVAGIVIPVQCGKKKQDALDILEEFDTFMEVYLSTGEFWFLKRQEKMHLKMSSAEVVCCKSLPNITEELSIEANSMDPEQTALGAVWSGSTVCHRAS